MIRAEDRDGAAMLSAIVYGARVSGLPKMPTMEQSQALAVECAAAAIHIFAAVDRHLPPKQRTRAAATE